MKMVSMSFQSLELTIRWRMLWLKYLLNFVGDEAETGEPAGDAGEEEATTTKDRKETTRPKKFATHFISLPVRIQ